MMLGGVGMRTTLLKIWVGFANETVPVSCCDVVVSSCDPRFCVTASCGHS